MTTGTGYGGMEYGDGVGYGGPAIGIPVQGKLKCVPVTPGTLTIRTADNFYSVTDDGQGGFTGNGSGTIDYRTGHYVVILTGGASGQNVLADYLPQEGGCSDVGCGACKTSAIRLSLTPGPLITGQSQVTITDAYKRMLAKIMGIIPIHVRILPYLDDDSWFVAIGTRYDIVAADVQPDDDPSNSPPPRPWLQVIWS